MIRKIVFWFVAFMLCSCSVMETGTSSSVEPETTSYLPNTFSDQNILSTHVGMTSDNVLKLYGNPKSISQSVCGSAVIVGTWTCRTWKYGKSPYDNATFTFAFSDRMGALAIFSFDIERSKSTLPNTFTSENILKLHQGMSHTQIFELFGAPRNVRQSECGGSTDKPWLCTTWEYGNSPYGNASFTFRFDKDSLILNTFKVDKD